MIRYATMVLALGAGLVGPAAALDLSAMTEAEERAFGEAVRDYLLENPLVLREAIEALQAAEAEDSARLDADLVAAHADAIFEDGHSFVGGNPQGDVTLVEFLDYRCSYCRRAHPNVAELVESDGGIRIIVKEFPILGPESLEASRFATAVLQLEGDEAYRAISDALMTRRGTFDRAGFAAMARDAGHDAEAILAHMDSDAVTEVIRANHALAQELDISGTPTFVVGDTMLRGYLPLDAMREVVAEVRGDG